MSREAEERLTVATFVAELQANLRSAEKELDAFFRDPLERSGLPDAQKALAQVSGALALLGHDDVHRAIDHARETIALFQGDQVVDQALFDELAQTLGAVGFYVEQIKRDRIDPDAFHFDAETGRFTAVMARPAVAEPVVAAAEPIAAVAPAAGDRPAEPVPYSDIAFAATQVLDTEATLEDEIAHRAADASEHALRLRADPGDRHLRDQLASAVDDVRRNAALIDDRSLQDEAATLLAALRRAGHAPLGPSAVAKIAESVLALAARANRSVGVAVPAVAPLEPAVAVPSADNRDAMDAELLEVFLEEADGVLVDAESSLRVLEADPINATATVNLRRGFHTLKGSSRMVGLMAFGDAAWAIEDTLNSHIADQVEASRDLRALIDYAVRYLGAWVDELRDHGASTRIPDALIEGARAVRHGMPAGGTAFAATEVLEAPSAGATSSVDPDDFARTMLVPGHDAAPPDSAWIDEAPILPSETPFEAEPFFASAEAVEAEAAEATEASEAAEPDSFDWLDIPPDAAPPAIEALPEEPVDNVVAFPMRVPATASDEVRQIGPLTLSVALFNIYLSEADELLRVLTQDFAEWAHELDRFVSERAMRAAHSLAGSSATVGLVPAHDVAAGVEEVLQALYRAPVELRADQVDCLQEAVESLRRMLHRFAAERLPEPDPVQVAALIALKREIAGDHETAVRPAQIADALPFEPLDFGEESATPRADADEAPATQVESGHEPSAPAAEAGDIDLAHEPEETAEPIEMAFIEPGPDTHPHEADVVAAEDQLEALTVAADNSALAVTRRPSEHVTTVEDDIDADLLDVFVEEGNEILPQIGTLLRTWQAHRDNPAPSRTLLRHLHTLKGSARMAGAMRLGELVHEIEARVEAAARLDVVPAPLIDELLAAHDRSLELFDRLQNEPVAPSVAETAVAPEAVASQPEPAAAHAAPRPRETKQASQQMVRVSSETLDRLVNLAGEVSISRARIENEVLQIKDAMGDLAENVERLRAQLREIELQAEFQMQSKMQSQQGAGDAVDKIGDKFDPLEFDRFTRFQELTRMMAESVNDVKTVQQNLQKSLDVAEVDLTSQRRMTRDLQQDLMAVRMVPFSSIAERLYRVARRSAKEVDKRVNLDIRGGTVEIDRSVLERMAGSFEHLLRNHIVHGIESRDARRASGKSEIGELLVEIRQEGNEIVLTFSDDGAGLDRARIRAKGRELGLIGEVDLDDTQVTELIFHPGFSTAREITELAGRGVGMEVVRAEATELAGRVTVDSEAGKGTRFTINLPLTLAVTQVVLVAVASRVYALPSVLVEQVQQLRQQPLAEAYRAGHLDVGGAPVRIAFLGTLLGIDDCAPVAQRTSPVLILRSAGERIAIHVDEVVGNQEVVVKNLGPQLARMAGIAGATVLGSGEIVLILNPVPLALAARADAAKEIVLATPAEESAAQAELKTLPTVMVVDDSLTVRRVTQRLLSREGYQVVLAKDGVDALEQLQEFPPDVMLVDIEMPRMDGFDLTRNVRNDERYKSIPIIMITSRTAEKHRRHAAELGVDAYLGKPYQEDELLDLLATHVRARRGQAA
jgi:chemosensory pili system protein ChpA (sensor histidine kinase/response regulator)